MVEGDRKATARVEVQGRSFSVILDNGSRESNFISERAAEQCAGPRYQQVLRVKTGDGKITEVSQFLFLLININFKETVRFCSRLKFFIFPNLPCSFIIGRGDLVKYEMYSLMEEIDREELDSKGEERNQEDADMELMEAELAALQVDTREWATEKEQEDAEFESYVTKLRKEIMDMIHEEYADVFATKPPKEPARVWEQQLNLVGAPIDSPAGLKDVPASLKGNGRRLPPKYVEAATKQIAELLEQGVIENSTSPISVPIMLTPKQGTEPLEMRFCLDCRGPNQLIRRENFPMGGMNEFIAWMEEVQPEYFIKLDLKAMYFQMPLEQRSRLLTAFNFGIHKYQFTRVVMGIANSVGHTQMVMVNQVLQGLVMRKVFSYLDDIMIPGNRTKYNIKEAMIEVFERFRKHKLYLNEAKCEFIVTETVFLGHKVSRRGVEINPAKRVDFQAAPRPTTTTTLRSFLALASYFRRFLPKFAVTAACLYKLTGGPKQRRIEWTEETETAFSNIKKMVQESVTLRWMTVDGKTVLYCDASKFGFGGGIFQDQGEIFEGRSVLTPIAFWGRAFSDYQIKWHTSDREMFAICFGILQYHHLLAGREFVVYTDHAALTSMKESASEKINRMKEKLSIYNMKLLGIAGKENPIGDGMSRIFISEDNYEPPTGDEDIDDVIEAYSNQSLALMSEEDVDFIPWMRYYHGERGHWALERTMKMIREDNNEWPGCETMMKSYIGSCEACVVNEPRRQRFHGSRFSLSGDRPGVCWAIDLKEVGEGYEGHKFILVIIDEFSRRVTMFPLRGKSSEEATYYVWHHILDNGRPERIRYDPGREFNNNLLKGIIEFIGAQNIQTGAGDHQGNGIVERFIGELDGQLRRYYQSRPARSATDWIWFLPVIARNHNDMRHSATGVAPNELHGDKFWGLEETDRQLLLEFVKNNILKSKPKGPDRANGEKLQVGAKVYIAVDTKEKRNLEAANWEGPFTIQVRRGDMVEVTERKGLEYHIARLKLAGAEEILEDSNG
jgi:hypothetical protein